MDDACPAFPAFTDSAWSGSGIEVMLRKGGVAPGRYELSAPGPRLFVMLDEVGGHLDARLRPDHGAMGGYRGARHLSFVPGATEVWGHCERPARFTAMFVQFDAELLAEAGAPGWLPAAQPRLMFEDPLLWQLAANLAAEVRSPAEGSRLLIDGLVQALAVRTVRAHDPVERRHGGLAAWQLRRVTEFMNRHLDSDITLAELAALADLSLFHFARAFKCTTGVSPGRYLALVRLERAKQLLCETDMRLIDVALEIGFDTPNSLTRLFRRETGDTPLRYRRANRAVPPRLPMPGQRAGGVG
jgi:AraC-like DNA-binding protein